jgi:cell division protein FtsB
MSAAGSYRHLMAARIGIATDQWARFDPRGSTEPSGPTAAMAETSAPDPQALGSLDGLGIAGLSRRRVAFLVGAVATIWIVAVFARQVGEASGATAKADELRAQNAALQAEISALDDELARISETPYVAQQARSFGVGSGRERPFVLDPAAPALAPDAPGSAALRLGASAGTRSPLETWLTLLFGSGRS